MNKKLFMMLALGVLGFSNLPATLAQETEFELGLTENTENPLTSNEEAAVIPNEEASTGNTESGNIVVNTEVEITLPNEETTVGGETETEAGEGTTTTPDDNGNGDTVVVTTDTTPFLGSNSGNILATAGTVAVGLASLILM